MKPKLKIVFLIYLLLFIASSCCNEGETYNVQIIEVKFLPINSFVTENENFEFDLRQIDSIVGIAKNGFDLKFIQSAYATDCYPEDIYKPIETIKDINIKLVTDFSEHYKSNEYITNIITVRHFNRKSQDIETVTLAEFLDFLNQDKRATGRSAELDNATYILSERPTINKDQQFVLEFIFTDNSSLTTLTEIITWE